MKNAAWIIGGLAVLGGATWWLSREERRRRLHQRARRVLHAACDHLGVTPPPLISTAGVDNAASDGAQVLYNPTFLEGLTDVFCSSEECQDAIVAAVMAHELGHHVNADVVDNHEHPHTQELRADRIAGWIVGRLGLGIDDAERVFATFVGSGTHPAALLRVHALRTGYSRA